MGSNLAFLLGTPRAWVALTSWPKFSVTSYRMVSSLARQGIRPATVIDVGANVGQFTVACTRFFPDAQIHSFEPLPACAEALARNVKQIGRVRVYPLALGDVPGEALLHVNSLSHSSSLLTLGERHRQAFPDAREVSTVKVPVSTLDRELHSVLLQGCTLLKLDVQGYEARVLEGAAETLGRVDLVLLETSFRPLYEGERTFMEVVRMMDVRGFEFLRPAGWLEDPRTGEALQMDALFARRGSEAQCAS
jgi:FkbM family methyltransferase